VECFFSIITRQAIRRGSFASVKQLTTTVGAFINCWNDHPRPFAWTKDTGEILASIRRAQTKTSWLTATSGPQVRPAESNSRQPGILASSAGTSAGKLSDVGLLPPG
jgi:hypothetical protein